jgi:hypothetical protein
MVSRRQNIQSLTGSRIRSMATIRSLGDGEAGDPRGPAGRRGWPTDASRRGAVDQRGDLLEGYSDIHPAVPEAAPESDAEADRLTGKSRS